MTTTQPSTSPTPPPTPPPSSPVAWASEFIEYHTQTDAVTNAVTLTYRKATDEHMWLFSAANGESYMVKFDKNFVKKHLFTYSKKKASTDEVEDRWKKAGSDPAKHEEFVHQVGLESFNQKAVKVLNARGEAKLCGTCWRLRSEHKCKACNHSMDAHLKSSGAPRDCNDKPCSCLAPGGPFVCPGTSGTNFSTAVGTYAAHRTTAGKSSNPLSGASTIVNTCIVLNRIHKSLLTKVIVDAISKEEHTGQAWDIRDVATGKDGKKNLTLDMSSSSEPCVVTANLTNPASAWTWHKGVILTFEKESYDTGTKQAVYKIVHLEGTI